VSDEGIVYLRLSDFRDEDPGTFDARREELVALSAELGFPNPRVVVENDVDGQGKLRGASAHKRTAKVQAAGLVTLRTRRPRYHQVMLDLQARGGLLLVSDESRLTRDYRDGEDLLDACEVGGASVVALDDEGGARWVLTNGGTRAERSAFRDRVTDARKFSEDIGRKVRGGRRRWAGRSYQGGPRPFGYEVDRDTAEHHRTLLVVPAEAAALKAAEVALLDQGWSLAAVTRRLREQGPPTATGAARWTTNILRDVLLKPTVAGLAWRGEELVEAPWEAIIDRPRWEALRALLTDPARRTSTANEPRWLVSCFATCGVCGGKLRAGGSGVGRVQGYVGSSCNHIRRSAEAVDRLVADAVIEWLERFADSDRLRPRASAGDGGAGELRAELARHRKARKALMELFEGDLDALAAIRAKDRRIAEIDAQLGAIAAAGNGADPLAELRPEARGAATVRAVWEALEMPRKRAVLQVLVQSVVINRAGPGRGLSPETIVLTWRSELNC
jgi:site-specific DNA recombinase